MSANDHPIMRSDGHGPHPPVADMFLTKDEFHEYVLDNRDRQDANKKEIIDTLQDSLGGRVSKLEDENTKQNRIAGAITAINASVLAILAFLK